MKVSAYKSIRTQDYDAQYQPLVEKLANSVNPAFNELITALNANLSLTDNFKTIIKSVSMTCGTTTALKTPITIVIPSSLGTGVKAIGAIPILVSGSNGAVPTSGVTLTLQQESTNTGNQVVITNATGLPNGVPFTVTVLILF